MAEVDTSFYKDATSENPLDVAGKVVDYRNKLLGNQRQQIAVQSDQVGLDNAKVELAVKRFGIMNSAVSGLMGDPDFGKTDLRKKINDVVGRLVKDEVLTVPHAVEALKGIPDDPQQQATAIRNIYSQTLSAEQRGQAFLGTPQVQETGAGKVITQTPQYPGKPTVTRATIENRLTPGTEGVDNNPRSPTYGQKSPIGSPGIPPVLQGGAPAGPTVPAAPARAAVAPAAAATPAGKIVTALPPGQNEAANVAGGAAGVALGDARNRSLNYQQEVNPLEQAIPALEKLGTKGTGPGTESINHIKSFVLSNVPGADFKGLKDDVATYDKAKKYLTDFVNQNGNSGTNDKLAAAFAGNPSVNISNAAAVDVAKTALALRRFKQAQLVAFESSGKPDADFAKEAGRFARDHDPRAYGFDMMSPAERKKVIESLPKGKRELFMLDVQDAVSQGILKPPQAK